MNTFPSSSPRTRRESFADGLTVRVDEQGSGRPILLLHGGGWTTDRGWPGFGALHARTCPGADPPWLCGRATPEWFDSIDDLAFAYLDLLERLDLRDVLVIGSSMGGWIASAMALRDTTRLLSGLVLVDAGGIQVEGHPIADVSSLTPDELSALSFHNPAAFRVDPATVTPEQVAARAANFRTLYVYDQGQGMGDPKLKRRLKHVRIPVLVVWGASDGVIDPEYGRAYAQSFPDARFELIPEAGHLPQLEQPERLLTLVWEFADSISIQNV